MKIKSIKILSLPSSPDYDLDFPQSKRPLMKEYLEWRLS